MPNEQLNQKLQQLIQDVLTLPEASSLRRIALTKLVRAIQNSEALARPQSAQWPPSLYRDYFQEALQMTLMEVCQKCDQYDPQYSVMAWVNTILKRRFIDVIRKYLGRRSANSDDQLVPRFQTLSLDDLKTDIADSGESDEVNATRTFLRNDPEQILCNIRLTAFPHVTLQKILLMKCVEDYPWREISDQLRVDVSTLSSFYQRNLRNQKDYFARHLR
jgi:RNA polymerase sigma factor (sigma-70 family)